MSIDSVFSSLLHRGRLHRAASRNRELAREIQTLEKIDGFGRKWSAANYVGGYSSYSSLDKLHLTSPHFADLQQALEPHLRHFVRKLNWQLLGGKVQMTTCWVNAMGLGTYHPMHTHPGSVISGVYYVQVPRASSPLKIEDPRLSLMMAAPPRRASAPKSERNYLLLAPKPGEFVLFESWMRHEVPPQREQSRRLSVSFNYEWR